MFKTFLEHDQCFVKSVPFSDHLGKLNAILEIKADAAGNPQLGFGCYLPHTGQWFGKSWMETNWFTQESAIEAHHVIYELELFAITIAFKVFGPTIKGRVIIL